MRYGYYAFASFLAMTKIKSLDRFQDSLSSIGDILLGVGLSEYSFEFSS